MLCATRRTVLVFETVNVFVCEVAHETVLDLNEPWPIFNLYVLYHYDSANAEEVGNAHVHDAYI